MFDHRMYHAAILPDAARLFATGLRASQKIANDREKQAALQGQQLFQEILEKTAEAGYPEEEVRKCLDDFVGYPLAKEGAEKRARFFKNLFQGIRQLVKPSRRGLSSAGASALKRQGFRKAPQLVGQRGWAKQLGKSKSGQTFTDFMKRHPKFFSNNPKYTELTRLEAAKPYFSHIWEKYPEATLATGAGAGLVGSKLLSGGGGSKDVDIMKL